MKFYIISRTDKLSNKLLATARDYLEDFGMEWNEESPDVVLSIGGDGTLLHAFHKYSEKLADVAFVGIHTGHLAFMPIGSRLKLRSWFYRLPKKNLK